MRITARVVAFALAFWAAGAAARAAGWTTYRIPETGTTVEFPAAIFTELAGKPDGYGQRFRSADGMARLTVESAPNRDGESAAAFLARHNPPAHIVYKRITPRSFVVSSFRRDKIWYDRCNFANGYVHCILMSYPANEKRQWDSIVTRISQTLSGG